jgi:hypothetical protein
MRCVILVASVLGCGRLGFEQASSIDGRGDEGGVDSIDQALDSSSAAIPPGAVLWLRFDDDPVDGLIDSAGTHTTTCVSCPAQVAGIHGQALLFSSHLVTVATSPALLPTAPFTIAAWVRVDSAPSAVGNSVVVAKQITVDMSYAISVTPSLRAAYYSSSAAPLNGTGALALGTWHHLALTWDGATKRGYLDGVVEATAPIGSISAAPAGPLEIGNRSTFNPLPLVGAIDDIVFYQRTLGAVELAQLATP